MALRLESLDTHLGKTLAPLYVLHGDEPLLALEAADAIRTAARKRGHVEREVLSVERGFDWSALLHAGASQSLFGESKFVELRIPTGKPGAQGAEAIIAYCARPAPGVATLVSLPRLDRSGQKAAWFAALAEAGQVIDVFPIERARLPAWIGARLARQGQRAAPEVLEFLAERVEGNLLAAHQEVLKLALLAPQGELAFETVRNAIADVARYDAWDASAALLGGDRARYLRVIEGLRAEGEAPTFVLWAIAEDLRVVRALVEGQAAGRPVDAILREQRVWGPRQAQARSAARRHRAEDLHRALLAAAEIDRAIKGVARIDPWDGFVRLGLTFDAGSPSAQG